VKLRDSQLGPVLFSGSDRAVYTFTRDGTGDPARSRCHGDCAAAWPPFFAKGRPRAAVGVKRSLLGTIRRGSRRQLTYRGQPLYFYVSDPKGEVLCNNIVEFGGTWFAVTAQGKPPV
jgi:predicted lipoprotein with Yx(FWY)xxD motif